MVIYKSTKFYQISPRGLFFNFGLHSSKLGNRCNLNLESAGCLSASLDNFVVVVVDVVVDADVFIDV